MAYEFENPDRTWHYRVRYNSGYVKIASQPEGGSWGSEVNVKAETNPVYPTGCVTADHAIILLWFASDWVKRRSEDNGLTWQE